jgi:hypothetical protein
MEYEIKKIGAVNMAYWRKNDTVQSYLDRKLSKLNTDGIYNGHDIANAKQKAYEHFLSMPINERLSYASFRPNSIEPTIIPDKLGCLYYGNVRIWVDINGNIYPTRPKSKEFKVRSE